MFCAFLHIKYCWRGWAHTDQSVTLKGQFTQKKMLFNHHMLTPMLMGSQVKFRSPPKHLRIRCMKPFLSACFHFFLIYIWKTSPHLLQLFRRMLKLSLEMFSWIPNFTRLSISTRGAKTQCQNFFIFGWTVSFKPCHKLHSVDDVIPLCSRESKPDEGVVVRLNKSVRPAFLLIRYVAEVSLSCDL